LLLHVVTSCDTNGPVAENGNGNETLEAEVKGRVPQKYSDAVDDLVELRRKKFPRYSRSDVLRSALESYFKKHGLPNESNGKAAA
jgi:hypothetical protein